MCALVVDGAVLRIGEVSLGRRAGEAGLSLVETLQDVRPGVPVLARYLHEPSQGAVPLWFTSP